MYFERWVCLIYLLGLFKLKKSTFFNKKQEIINQQIWFGKVDF